MSIILVGNGRSLIGRGLGPTIDSFDSVVRFNNFTVEGYEKDVGVKTDIIARRACDDIKLHKVVDNWPRILAFVSYSRYWQGMQVVARQLVSYYGQACCEIVPVDFCKKIGEEIGLEQPVPEAASIGALAIGYFLTFNEKFYPNSKLILMGFDGDMAISHYFPKPPKDGSFHSAEKEQAWISKLKQEGKVKCL